MAHGGGTLDGKRGLIVGVANPDSIAAGCATAMARNEGASLAITYLNDRARPHVQPVAQAVDAAIFAPLDVRSEEQLDALFAEIAERWGRLDFLVHSIAFCPKDDLHARVVDCSLAGFTEAMDVSCHSLLRLARRAAPLMTDGGAILTISYQGAAEVVEHYNIMGPVKAALEASVRYLAVDLAESGIRVNAISPGPLKTRAASGIAHFDDLITKVAERTPAHKLVGIEDVGALAAFLASDQARAITGGVHYVDGGFSVMA